MRVGGIKNIQVLEGQENEFERLFSELQGLVKEDHIGNIYYDLFKSRTKKGAYVVSELYEDQASWQKHQDAEYGREYFPKIRSLLSHIEVEYFDAV
ncbi:MAG: putative quinol monooxygenase [Candidatus Gracilibacteria bacterium]